jgi:predicted DNA-binding protein YlxM (UPF0122 family)
MEQTVLFSLDVQELKELIRAGVSEVLSKQPSTSEIKEYTDDLLNIQDIQKIFKVSRVTVHKWKKKGLLPFHKMNRKVYFKKSEIIDAMQHKTRKLEV